MKNPLLYRSARPESGREARERVLMETLGRTQSERRRRLALAGSFSAPQIVWNRSTRRAGAGGGARIGRPRWLGTSTLVDGLHRRLTIGGGQSRQREAQETSHPGITPFLWRQSDVAGSW